MPRFIAPIAVIVSVIFLGGLWWLTQPKNNDGPFAQCQTTSIASDGNGLGGSFELINAKGKKPSDITNEIQEDIIKKIEYHNHKLIPLLRYSIRGELADGFIPSDVSLRPLVKKYIDRVLIKIDKSKLTSKILSEKAKLVSDLKQNKVSVEALGIKILSEKMKIKDLDKLSFLFNALGDGDLEAAEKLL